MKKFVAKITGDGQKKSWGFDHDLNTKDFTVGVHDADFKYDYFHTVKAVTENTIEVYFSKPLDPQEEMTVVIVG